MAAMQTIPAARPSRPSMKFTALMVATTTRIVSTIDSFGVRLNRWSCGSGKLDSWAPLATRIPPAATWPASLPSAFIPQRSSIMPITTIRPPASSRPLTRPLPGNTLRSGTSWLATSSPAASPRYIAMPPMRGIGAACTSRSRAAGTARTLIANWRTSGVSRYVTVAVTRSVRKYSRTAAHQVGRCRASAQLYGTVLGEHGRKASVGPHRHGRDLAQLADREHAGPKQPGHLAGHVDDRGWCLRLARAAIEIDGNRVAKLLAGGSRRGHWLRPGQVGAAHGHRAGRLEQL